MAQAAVSGAGNGMTYAFPPYSVTVLSLPAPLAVTTGELPDAAYGVGYSQTLAASGGTPAYAWSLSGGTLPAGLSLSGSGVVSGTSAAAGVYPFTVQVIDSATAAATQALSIQAQNIPYSTWTAQHFTAAEQANPAISGPDADPNGDGLSNFLSFALNRDPKIAGPNPALPVSIQKDGVTGGSYLTLTYTRRKAPSGISYYVGASGDMLAWFEDSAHVQQVQVTDDGNGLSETVLTRAVPMLSSTNQQFLRLRVTEP